MSHGQGPPISTIDDVVQAVKDTLGAINALRVTPGDGLIEWLEGERYEQIEGAPPRIMVIVGDNGGIVAPQKLSAGYIAGFKESATFYVWGAETTADGDRYRAAHALCMRLINCFAKVAPGRVQGGRVVRGATPGILTFGEEYQLSISFTCDVPRDAAIWDVPVSPLAPVDPNRPNGGTGRTIVIDTTANPITR